MSMHISLFMSIHVKICIHFCFILQTCVCICFFPQFMCRRGAVRLGMSKVTQVDFLPKEMVSYSKETQTPTELMTHTDQKAGKETLSPEFHPR